MKTVKASVSRWNKNEVSSKKVIWYKIIQLSDAEDIEIREIRHTRFFIWQNFSCVRWNKLFQQFDILKNNEEN